jgi:prolyl 4-hydroxylase
VSIVVALVAIAVVVVAVRAGLVLRARARYAIREVPGFLSDEECAHLIELARPRLRQSAIVRDGVRGTIDTQRRSGSAFLDQAGDPIVKGIKRRIAELTGTEVDQQERLQITHYHPGERYAPHFDALGASGLDTGDAGDRVWTVILYLNGGFDGGATVFPRVWRTVRAEKGKALVFRNLVADGSRHDPLSLHAGATVSGGEKWLSNQWIRERQRYAAAIAGRKRRTRRR